VGVWNSGEDARFYQPVEARGTLSATFATDEMLVLGATDGKVTMFDLALQDDSDILRARTLSESHDGAVHSLASSPDGLRFISGSSDKSLIIWDTKKGEVLHRLYHNGAVLCVAWSTNGKYIASGSEDCTIRIWTSEGKPLSTTNAHSAAVSSVAFRDDEFIISGSRDGSIRFWNRGSDNINPIGRRIVRNSPVNAIAFSSDKTCFAAVYDDAHICLWDIRSICGDGSHDVPSESIPEA